MDKDNSTINKVSSSSDKNNTIKIAPTITVIRSSDTIASITVGTCHCSS